jgi:hypothetical protein
MSRLESAGVIEAVKAWNVKAWNHAFIMEHLFFGPARACFSPLAGPRRWEGAASLQAHTHLTSREAGSEIWIYEDLWKLRKEWFRFCGFPIGWYRA